jgi:hypothetical protein
MIEKEYYRLDELEKRFDLSFSDVLYLVENSKLDLAFRLTDNKFIIGGWAKGNRFIGYASVKYSGFASITQKDQVTLLSKHKANCKYFWLLNKDKIVSTNYDYPFESKTPNAFLHTWQPKQPSDISWDRIPAKLFPKEQEHIAHTLKNAMSSIKTLSNKQSKPSEYEKEFDAKIPKLQLYSEGINFELVDVCILHSELVKAGIAESKMKSPTEITPSLTPLTVPNQIPKTRSDDFYDLLIRLVGAEPELTAKGYWRNLERELDDLQEYRVFDKHNLLVEISATHINWKDRSGKPKKPMSFSSFSNRLTKVRKELFPNNNI